HTAKQRGYQIGKYPTTAFAPVSVFDLAVNLLMAVKGPSCTFVQVGANDGRYGDPIARFALRFPWRGILIEPQADVFARLRENCPSAGDRLNLENLAISRDRTELTLYRAPAHAGGRRDSASTVVSANPNVTGSQLKIPASQLEAFRVP